MASRYRVTRLVSSRTITLRVLTILPLLQRMIRTWRHLASAVLSLLSFSTVSVIAPLVMWFIYKDKPGYNFTKESARRAFNFNFSLWVISTASWVAIVLTFGLLGIVLWVVPLVVTILMVVFHSLAAVAAAHCNLYEYPMTFVKVIR